MDTSPRLSLDVVKPMKPVDPPRHGYHALATLSGLSCVARAIVLQVTFADAETSTLAFSISPNFNLPTMKYKGNLAP